MIPLLLLALNTPPLFVCCGAPESPWGNGTGWGPQTFPYRLLSIYYIQTRGFALLS